MEVQLQELIEQIRKEGVETAEKEAAAKLQRAEEDAARIRAAAKAEADHMIQQAKEESERYARVSDDAIKQASRNVLISFRESVTRELNALVGAGVRAAYSKDTLARLVPRVVEAWAAKAETEDLAVLLPAEDLQALQDSLAEALKEHLAKGLTLKPSEDFAGGFRVAADHGQVYYDYSAEAVTDLMAAYLNPKVTALMKEAERV